MKQKTENEKLTDNQKLKGIRNVTSGKYLTNLIIRRDLNIPNIFLIQNKGKGPPGRTRSPGLINYLSRANQPAAFNELRPKRSPEFIEGFIEGPVKGSLPELVEGNNTFNENELLIHTKPNRYSQLNFTIMKKHLFILILAVFAINLAWGQAVHNTNPNALTCTDDALHPIAGKPYAYTVDVSANAGGDYQWWATQQTTFIQNGAPNLTGALTVTTSQLLYASPGYGASGSSYSTQTITWSSEILAATISGTATGSQNPTFVAVMYDNAGTICANNFKAYQIDPRNGFTVDIFPIQITGSVTQTLTTAGATASSCVGDVASVTWSGSQMLYDYGTATATFEVVAANFSGGFVPSFNVVLNAAQTAVVEWSYTSDFASVEWTSAATAAGGGVVTSTVSATTTVSDTSQGVSIYARLIISNNTFEALQADTRTLTLAVNAVNSVSQSDVVNTDCTLVQSFEDIANYELLPRPTLVPNTPTGGFVPENSTH